ncbi:MAG: DUF373 family protein [Halobacteria archaeon]|nr:DUF373 family protein [Halobacteria archaeon]
MLLVICVDSDDDIGRKTDAEGPIVGRDSIEEVALSFGTADPEDSDLNAMFEAMRIYDEEVEGGRDVEVAALTGSSMSHKSPEGSIADQIDELIQKYDVDSAIVVTDGAEDESVIPVVESRLKIDGVSRTVVRQAENLENAYHVLKQVLSDPETRGTILVPLGILFMIYPIEILMSYLDYPNAALGISAGLVGVYFIIKGLGLEDIIEDTRERVQEGIYSGKISLITYLISGGLVVIGAAAGFNSVQNYTQSTETVIAGAVPVAMAFVRGVVVWLTVAGVISSVGRIVDEYIQRESFPRVYLNAPFYIISMGFALYGVSGFFIGRVNEVYLTAVVVISIGIGISSTVFFGSIGRREGNGESEGEKEPEPEEATT